MSERPTPETDAVAAHEGNWDTKFFRMKHHADRLERERDEAHSILEQVTDRLEQATIELIKLQSQRDEAREQIDNIRKMLSESGEAVGNGEHNYSIIEMIQNLIRSKSYFIRKSYAELERAQARERDEYYARAASLVLRLPPETIAGEVQQWRDEFKADREKLIRERDEAREELRIAVGLLSTQPQFADKHPEDVLAFVKEGVK
jgi:uncharacterized coiled-coil DUF342 family protein